MLLFLDQPSDLVQVCEIFKRMKWIVPFLAINSTLEAVSLILTKWNIMGKKMIDLNLAITI